MNLVTNGILMVSAASLTLCLIHLRLCFQQHDRLRNILFVFASFGLSCYALFERALMMAATPAEHGELLRWAHLFVWLVVVSVAWFVHFFLEAGHRWILWALTAFRTAALIANFTSAVNLNYREITQIKQITVFGETLSVAVGVPNPWMIIGQISLLLFLLFSVDATISSWRRGERRRAITVGASLIIFALSGFVMAISVLWGFALAPLYSSPFFLAIIAAMSYELSRDLQRASELSVELVENKIVLAESISELHLSADAASVGIWTRSIRDETITASEKWCELFEFDSSKLITYQDYLQKIHRVDRKPLEKILKSVEENGGEYETEYRIVLENGDIRWIGSRGKADLIDGKPVRLRGASVDITKRKAAEEAAHDLSRQLIGAQEKERARLARELHDGLSQSLALLSIQLEDLGRDGRDPEIISERITDLTTQIQALSSDVHRISHELHPAKLSQLGLEAALKGLCREIAATRGIKVRFEADDVPSFLPDDISLCLYRITQESLQNVIKHSDAGYANVKIDLRGGNIRLSVSDNGSGFDPEAAKSGDSLGLISMSERIRAVKGTVTIYSTLGAGTQIIADIPIPVK